MAGDLNKIIGKNIESLRKRFNMTQEQVANFLDIDRVMVAYYENGTRPTPMGILDKLSDLFCVDVSVLMEENEEIASSNIAFAFRAGEINESDVKDIASFHKIIKNYIKINQLRQKNNSNE